MTRLKYERWDTSRLLPPSCGGGRGGEVLRLRKLKKKLIQSGTGAQFLGKSRGSSLTVARFFAAHHALSKYKVTYQSARQQQWGTGAQNHILNRDPTPRELTE